MSFQYLIKAAEITWRTHQTSVTQLSLVLPVEKWYIPGGKSIVMPQRAGDVRGSWVFIAE